MKRARKHFRPIFIWGWFFPAIVAIILILTGCSKSTAPGNAPPVIKEITANPDFALPGSQIQLVADVFDPDGDPVRLKWSTYKRAGKFTPDTSESTMLSVSSALLSGMKLKLTLLATDGHDSTYADKWIQIDTGNTVSGYVYHPSTAIPISGAIVTMADRADTSDTAGYYILPSVASGSYTLEATLAGYGPYSALMEVNGNIDRNIYLQSEYYTTILSGNVLTMEGNVLPGAHVSVLNPDGFSSDLVSVADFRGGYAIDGIPVGLRQLVIQNGENPVYDLYPDTIEVEVAPGGTRYNLIGRIRRIAFESIGIASPELWKLENDGAYQAWKIDTAGNCYRFDFPKMTDFGKLAMAGAVSIPLGSKDVHWIIEADLVEAATDVYFSIDGFFVYGNTIGGGTRKVMIDSPIDISQSYLIGHNVAVEFYVWQERAGIPGRAGLNRFSIYYYR